MGDEGEEEEEDSDRDSQQGERTGPGSLEWLSRLEQACLPVESHMKPKQRARDASNVAVIGYEPAQRPESAVAGRLFAFVPSADDPPRQPQSSRPSGAELLYRLCFPPATIHRPLRKK